MFCHYRLFRPTIGCGRCVFPSELPSPLSSGCEAGVRHISCRGCSVKVRDTHWFLLMAVEIEKEIRRCLGGIVSAKWNSKWLVPRLWNRGGFYQNDKARSLQKSSDGFPQPSACSVFSPDLEPSSPRSRRILSTHSRLILNSIEHSFSSRVRLLSL